MKQATGGEIKNVGMTVYQKRYLQHQQFGKKDQLIAIMRERHSQRQFGNDDITDKQLEEILQSTKTCMSSCDRFGVRVLVIKDRDDKALLNGILVGGVGWIYRANVILLLVADPVAYQANGEIDFMPFLHAGVLINHIGLMVTSLGLRSAYCNPNIRPQNQEHFKKIFKPSKWDDMIFCGAIGIGTKNPDEIHHERNLLDDITVER